MEGSNNDEVSLVESKRSAPGEDEGDKQNEFEYELDPEKRREARKMR